VDDREYLVWHRHLGTQPIVAERATYRPDLSVGWREPHNSFGLTTTALAHGRPTRRPIAVEKAYDFRGLF
jgi:hypothetical protein